MRKRIKVNTRVCSVKTQNALRADLIETSLDQLENSIDKIFKLIYLVKYGHPQSLRHLIEFHRHAKVPLMGKNKISH